MYQFVIHTSGIPMRCLDINDLERQIVWMLSTRIMSWFKVADRDGRILMAWSECNWKESN